MSTWIVTAEGHEVLIFSRQYLEALKREDDDGAWDADARVSAVAERVLSRDIRTESDLVTLALAARHFDIREERPSADEGRSAYQNGAIPLVLVDEVLRLAGLTP